MYLFGSDTVEALETLADNLDAIENFTHVSLGNLNMMALLDVSEGTSSTWVSAQPALLSEANGLVIVPFGRGGLDWLQLNVERLQGYGIEASALQAFAAKSADAPLFLLDTF